jgi:hypothetical protein
MEAKAAEELAFLLDLLPAHTRAVLEGRADLNQVREPPP